MIRQGMLFLTLCIALVGCSHHITVPGVNTTTQQPKPSVLVFMGQSNMTGVYETYQGPAATGRITYFNNPGNGPIIPIADSIPLTGKIITVNCAKGGTYISQWTPGQPLFDSCVQLVAAAVQQSSASVRGIFWMQGESDTQDNALVTHDWAQSFYIIMRTMRSRWNAPVVYGRIGRFNMPDMTVYPSYQHIRNEQQSISMDRAEMVDTDAAPLIDGLHHTPEGYKMIGAAMVKAWNDIEIGD